MIVSSRGNMARTSARREYEVLPCSPASRVGADSTGVQFLCRPAEYLPCVIVDDQSFSFGNRNPSAGGNSLVLLRDCLPAGRLEQVKVAELMDQHPTQAKPPVNRLQAWAEEQFGQAGFLGRFAERRIRWAFPRFNVALGKTPMLVAIPD